MERIPKPQELHDVAEEFIDNELSALISVIGSRSVYESFLAARENGEPTQLQDLLNRTYQFAVNAIESGQETEDQPLLDMLCDLDLGDGVCVSTLQDRRQALMNLSILHQARISLELDDPASATLYRNELALLSGLSEETIRLAAYSEDDAERLAQDRGGLVRAEEAKRWLLAKNLHKPFQPLPKVVHSPTESAKTVKDLAQTFYAQGFRMGLSRTDLRGLFGEEQRPGWAYMLDQHGFDLARTEWLTPANARTLGEILNLDPVWTFDNLHRLRAEAERRQLLTELEALREEPPLTEAPTDRPVTAELVREVITSQPGLQRHPAQRTENKKLDGYQLDNGLAFAHQHETKTQYLWVPAELPIDDERLVTNYPAIGAGETAGRHSGLLKFPELGRTAVKKVQIRHGAVLNDILNMLRKGV